AAITALLALVAAVLAVPPAASAASTALLRPSKASGGALAPTDLQIDGQGVGLPFGNGVVEPRGHRGGRSRLMESVVSSYPSPARRNWRQLGGMQLRAAPSTAYFRRWPLGRCG
ncbi:MAG: hypothetical protein QOI83_2770, partial [Streptomycetaceae bacterium]|nr:hypothetical protein [Streptomycetaceae bacterium]